MALRIRQLAKHPEDIAVAAETLRRNRMSSKEQFERRFATRLVQDSYPPGTLILVRNSGIEKSANRKHKPRYTGPYEIDRRLPSGSYVIKELDGTISRQAIAAFRVIPYIACSDPRLATLHPLGEEDSSSDDEESAPEDLPNIREDSASESSGSDSE